MVSLIYCLQLREIHDEISSVARNQVAKAAMFKKMVEGICKLMQKDGGERIMLRGFQEMLVHERAEGFAEGLKEVRKETEREQKRAEKAEKELAELKARYERKMASIV